MGLAAGLVHSCVWPDDDMIVLTDYEDRLGDNKPCIVYANSM